MSKKELKIGDLNKMFEDGVTQDKEIFAEQRSHVLLINGDHYSKRNWKWLEHVRQNTTLDTDQKIRLTRNHMNRIHKNYVNKIVSLAPSTHIDPQNEKERKDQKAAQLNSAVWNGIKYRQKFSDKVHRWAGSYTGIGELFVLASWDWDKGYFKKAEPKLDQFGEQIGEDHLYTGDIVWEEIFGFNIFRPKSATNLDDAPWLGIQKMVEKVILERKYGNDEQKKGMIEPDGKTTYLVFDDSGYKESKDTVLVKTIYMRPSAEFKNGYYYMFTSAGVLEQGELPAGLFPIRYCLFDEVPTHPRGRSTFKQLKPYQVEINRVGSKMAEHQITLGDDKLVMSNGGKMQAGGQLNGVRGITVTGQNPMVIPGRTGEQYLGYANSIIEELYQVAMISEELESEAPSTVDPYALLLTSSRWKSRFAINIQKFERFLVELTELSLDLYRHFVEDDTLIKDIGTGEIINISEFKNSEKLCYQIKITPGEEDLESRIGKKMSIDRYIQYSAGQLQKEDLGKFLRLDPYLNKEKMFEDFTMDYDNAENDMLQLDRGQMPLVTPYKYTDINYIIKKLSGRMGQSDYQFMPPEVHALYDQLMQTYQQMLQQKIIDEAALNAQFIPTGGALVRADLWIQDPMKPDKQVRASFPYEALNWLKERLEAQGMTQEALVQQRDGLIMDMANKLRTVQPPQQQQALEQPQADLKQRLAEYV